MNSIHIDNGFKISQSGVATQVVILCHGGWKAISRSASRFARQSGDGYTDVPFMGTVYFYTGDTTPATGYKAFEAIINRVDETRLGLKQLNTAQQAREAGAALDAKRRLLKPTDMDDATKMAEIDRLNRIADERKYGIEGVINRATNSQQIKNYWLGVHEPVNRDTFPLHVSERAGFWHSDIDLLVREQTRHKRHLSDAFEACKNSPGGKLYSIYHYCACRVDRDTYQTTIEHEQ